MLNTKLKKVIAALAVVLCVGYVTYDFYFRLPAKKTPAQTAEQKESAKQKLGLDKFNILVLGVDGRENINDRADTIILASVDGKTNEAQLLSIPRDTRLKIKGAWNKVNAAYAFGGVDLTKKTISEFLDVEIDRYVVVDFNSLINLVDEVGGIEVNVPVRMYVPLEGIDLKPGTQNLNGLQVLAYSRFRGTSEGDIGRAKRQQEVITLLAREILKASNLPRLPQLISLFQQDVKTDLSVKELVALARIAPDALDNGISTLVLPGKNKKIDEIWYWEPDIAALAELLSVPFTKTIALFL